MTLDDYLRSNGLSDPEFAARIGCARTTITRLRERNHRPDWKTLDLIFEATEGAVTPNDFMPPEKQKGAA